ASWGTNIYHPDGHPRRLTPAAHKYCQLLVDHAVTQMEQGMVPAHITKDHGEWLGTDVSTDKLLAHPIYRRLALENILAACIRNATQDECERPIYVLGLGL